MTEMGSVLPQHSMALDQIKNHVHRFRQLLLHSNLKRGTAFVCSVSPQAKAPLVAYTGKPGLIRF